MRTAKITAALTALTLFSATASGAVLESIQGTVLVNQGTGFQPQGDGASLKPGDRIMVNPGGSARIVYSDGCSQTVVTEKVFTVPAQPTCAPVGQTESVAGVSGTGVSPLTSALVTAGVVAGGAAVATGVASSNRKHEKPASP